MTERTQKQKPTPNRTEETVNFEISRTVRQRTRESGEIQRLSVAVLVDGSPQVVSSPRDRDENLVHEEGVAVARVPAP